MMETLNDPFVGLALFFICCALAIGSLLNSMKSGGSAGGILMALIFAVIAAYFSPVAWAVITGAPTN